MCYLCRHVCFTLEPEFMPSLFIVPLLFLWEIVAKMHNSGNEAKRD